MVSHACETHGRRDLNHVPAREKGEAKFLPERLRQLMEDHGLSKKRLAEGLGSNPSTVGRWLEGTTTPTLHFVNRIAEYFNVRREVLVEEEPPSPDAWEAQLLRVASQLDDFRKGVLIGYATKLLEDSQGPGTSYERTGPGGFLKKPPPAPVPAPVSETRPTSRSSK
jgi:transcriptional regulator with XRE-family HTH domain